MRLALILLGVLVALLVVVPLLKRLAPPRGSLPPTGRDELVKDPVCQTYIVRSRAVVRESAAGPRYFCSVECARHDTGA